MSWVRTADRKPKPGVMVLVASETKTMGGEPCYAPHLGCINREWGGWELWSSICLECGHRHYGMAPLETSPYWMPLPALPAFLPGGGNE